MEIKFYITPDEPHDLNKTKNNELTLQGTIKENCSVLNPIIEIKRNNNIFGYNYCYIPVFKRYYYITNFTVNVNGFISIGLKVDALESFKTSILNSEQVITRQENFFNLQIVDSKLPLLPKKKKYFRNLGVSTNPLTTNGNDVLNKAKYFYILKTVSLTTSKKAETEPNKEGETNGT